MFPFFTRQKEGELNSMEEMDTRAIVLRTPRRREKRFYFFLLCLIHCHVSLCNKGGGSGHYQAASNQHQLLTRNPRPISIESPL